MGDWIEKLTSSNIDIFLLNTFNDAFITDQKEYPNQTKVIKVKDVNCKIFVKNLFV